ncbi:MAG: methyltransferase [Methanomicrobiales archaeon]|nr:methyltransferase [Methanomicrobiales archaeon]
MERFGEQWYVKAARSEAEAVRRALLESGILDRSLRPRREGDAVLFPVITPDGAGGRAAFEPHVRHEELPRHELVGGIAIMQEKDAGAARALLAARPSLHTVLFAESAVEGVYRTRRFAVLAGEETTRTRYTEYGMRFEIDLSVAYFSARLANERQRIAALMAPGERVLDMFAGVGPFAVALAPRARIVYANDINPGAVHLMAANIRTNRRGNVVPVLGDAGRLAGIFAPCFDRIIMNLPAGSAAFLDGAAALCRNGATIHFYALQSEEGEFMPALRRLTDGRIAERVVRSYSPAQHHAVYDVRINKR